MFRVVAMLECPQPLLRDLDRHAQLVQQRRVDVAELVPPRSSEPGAPGRRL
jgi:hypothetical protein